MEKTLESPLDARRSNQSILKEISPEYSFEGLMLKLEFQYFGHLMQKIWLTGKDPDAEKDWRQEGKGRTGDEMVGWMASQTQRTWVWVDSGSWWWTRKSGVLRFMGSQRVRHDWATELNWALHYLFFSSFCHWELFQLAPVFLCCSLITEGFFFF